MAPLRDVILEGDVLQRLPEIPDESVDCVVTSPPYWALRDYGVPGQLGLEPSWREHMAALLPVFREIHRVLKPTGNLFVNYGDTVLTNAGNSKNPGGDAETRGASAVQPARSPNRFDRDGPGRKHKLGLHWRLRFLLNDELGFISRADIVWHKPNQMHLSMKDRVTPKYEMVFHFVKQPVYFYDLDPIRKPLEETADPRDLDRVRAAKDRADDLRARPGSKAFNIRVRDVKDGRTATLLARLRDRHPPPDWAYATEVQVPGRTGALQFVDAVAVHLTKGAGYAVHGFEAKVSRSDWLSELADPTKAAAARAVCDYWWILAGDEAIIRPDEVPDGVGLLVLRDQAIYLAVHASRNMAGAAGGMASTWDRAFLAAFLRRMDPGEPRAYWESKVRRAEQAGFNKGRNEAMRYARKREREGGYQPTESAPANPVPPSAPATQPARFCP